MEKWKRRKMSFDSFDRIGALISWRGLMLDHVCIGRDPLMIEDQRFWQTCPGQNMTSVSGQSHSPVEPDECNTTNGSL